MCPESGSPRFCRVFSTEPNNFPYPSVFAEFVASHNPSCTQCFWENFYRLFPDTPWHYVSFCHSCRHFDLYATEADMLADDPHRY
ncbi:hypothetical protein [Yersinia ruckeri]|uniref:hypothetical protein n=1 Tax=Yersinia ruckeri TaxID=29486 RepID=UPI001F42356C|nr:hypothetical protein [Yersinia ruckeri]UIN02607.1 hypothetical protein LGL91_17915 [Yersinia ruckeri]